MTRLASTRPAAEAAPLFERLINKERAREADLNKTTRSGIARIQFTENGIEFVHGKGIKLRAKLTWISPLKGMYLFTSPGANEALSVTPDALQAQLRCGKARIIEESSLIDRAVNRIFNSLSAANP